MDPQNSRSKPQSIDPSDLTYQIMPMDGSLSSDETKTNGPQNSEQPSSSFRSKKVYIIAGLIIVLIVAVVIYFLVGSKKNSTKQPEQTQQTKLPKVWLMQYFQKETCDDQSKCGDTADPDSDGLSNYEEFKSGTIPTMADTDEDGIADGDEVNIYKTEPKNNFTDTRVEVSANNWNDGYQIKNGYDPLTPGLKFTDIRKQQIAEDTAKYGLHEPTATTLKATASSSVDTSTWKTYANAQYGFEFKYPSQSTVTVEDSKVKNPQATNHTIGFIFDFNGINYEVVVYDQINETGKLSNYPDIETWIKSDLSAPSDLSQYTKTSIAGENAYQYNNQLIIYVKHGDRVYMIEAYANGSALKTQDALYTSFISTFKFTK